ncbi:putative serine protease K12H4.7 [Aplysia californica]|uniref:Serine protease K12H4.7 n=1 Tax=Aplysia californica TaxID=6500 RepID=A0ABM0JFQ6_APLCA|nr:putative serine protease K12H4.7 [Aplysia californica]
MLSRTLILGALLLAVVIFHAEAYVPRIIRGRPKGGFVGIPDTQSAQNGNDPTPPPDQWFEQKQDHFDGINLLTWKQRFFSNGSFYKKGGPMFVQIGGEGEANPIWMMEGAWVDYAKKYNAYCFLLEHRFYGKSHPTPDMSVNNLRYLSSEQALSDLATFITAVRKELGGPKVIVFGGSYPGSLAAWFRMKYPHIAHGAVASSAPLLAKINFFEYMEVVDSALRTFDASGTCNNAVAQATQGVQELMSTYKGRRQLKSLFQLCDDLDPNSKKDISNFYSTIAGNFEGVVQYNKDNRAFEGAVGTNITIDTLCGIMTDTSKGSPTERYAAVNSLMLKTYSQKCQDFKYDKMIDEMRQTQWNSSAAEGGRQWTYQTCTEFAFYQSSDSKKQPFGHGFGIQFWLDQCSDIFGPEVNVTLIQQRVERSNEDYGALGIRISRVVFPNGSIDPWHALGVLKDLGPDAKAIFINGTAHCANMYPPTAQDLPALVAARTEIETSIGQWLAD